MASVQQTETPSPSQPYTILRIKRKRNEEPLEALVVESKLRSKKSRGPGVFRYAHTVEEHAWEDERQKKEIHDRISVLSRSGPSLAEAKPVPPTAATGVKETQKPQPSLRPDASRTYTIVDSGLPDVEVKAPLSPVGKTMAKEPPPSSPADFRMYDAIPSVAAPTPTDPEMEKFQSMLQDYLRVHDEPTASAFASSTAKPSPNAGSSTAEGDYVWDVFYHRPATLVEWNDVANIGKLTGLPAGFGDVYDSASDSDGEMSDEADEDSNAEEYYKNDYPDEDSGSDEWHEDSDYEEMMHPQHGHGDYY